MSRGLLGPWMQGPDAIHADTTEVVWLEDGLLHGYIDGRRTSQQARQLTIIAAGCRHACWTQGRPVREVVVHLDAALLERRLGRRVTTGTWRQEQLPAAALADFLAAVPAAQAGQARALERAALTLLGAAVGGATDPGDARLARVLDALHADLARRWTVPAMARVAGLSEAYFSRQFQELVGASPMSYLSAQRVSRAAWLLSSTAASVTDIAHQVGFGSSSRLSEAFSKQRGVPPSGWRQRQATQARRAAVRA